MISEYVRMFLRQKQTRNNFEVVERFPLCRRIGLVNRRSNGKIPLKLLAAKVKPRFHGKCTFTSAILEKLQPLITLQGLKLCLNFPRDFDHNRPNPEQEFAQQQTIETSTLLAIHTSITR